MAFDDVYQEAYVKFLEMKDRYEEKVNSPRWFMSLYKTALANKITDLANMSNRLRRQVCFTELGDQLSEDGAPLSYQEALVGDLGTEGDLQLKIDEAPDEVRKVLSLVLQSPPELLAAMSDTWSGSGKRMDGGNQFLCSMLDYDPREVDLVELVKNYLEEVE